MIIRPGKVFDSITNEILLKQPIERLPGYNKLNFCD
jgi:hypothetical protein